MRLPAPFAFMVILLGAFVVGPSPANRPGCRLWPGPARCDDYCPAKERVDAIRGKSAWPAPMAIRASFGTTNRALGTEWPLFDQIYTSVLMRRCIYDCKAMAGL